MIDIDCSTLVLLIIALFAVIYGVYCRRQLNSQLQKMDDMLDKAIKGVFVETYFDESVLSYLENKLWGYLRSAEILTQKNTEEKEKIKTLIADISHQTKTPVANILLYTGLLSECNLSAEEKEYVNLISAQSEKLSFFVSSLIKLSRLETGIITLSPQKHCLSDMLQGVVTQAQPKADEKGLYLLLECNDETAVFDEKWTAEAIWNIVDNALKYTETGGVKITVKGYGMFVCIEISDTGCGIPEAEQARIFSRFYRVENTASEDGLGIGLYLTRQLITEQGGYVRVSSILGEGSIFMVFLSKL